MEIEVVRPQGWPDIDLPLSPALKYNGIIYVSGQVPFDQEGNIVGKGDIKKQTEQVLKNLERVVEAAGADLSDVLKVTVYIKEPSLFPQVNEVYRRFFKNRFPARTTIVADLTYGDMLIEIDAIARSPL